MGKSEKMVVERWYGTEIKDYVDHFSIILLKIGRKYYARSIYTGFEKFCEYPLCDNIRYCDHDDISKCEKANSYDLLVSIDKDANKTWGSEGRYWCVKLGKWFKEYIRTHDPEPVEIEILQDRRKKAK